MDTKQYPTNLGISSLNNSILILLKISLLFTCSPALNQYPAFRPALELDTKLER